MAQLYGANRRASPRISVSGVDGDLGRSPFKVIDLSRTGLQGEGTCHTNVGRRFAVVLEDGEQTARITGRVVWCRLIRTRRLSDNHVEPIYRLGIAFDEPLMTSLGNTRISSAIDISAAAS